MSSLIRNLKIADDGLIAHKDYWHLPEETKKKLCNGMGSEHGLFNRFIKWLIPDHFFGLDMTEAANIHDFMYWVGGTMWDKIVADIVFLYNMLRKIYTVGDKHRTKRTFMATRYFLAVLWGGKSSFNKKIDG